MRATKTKADHGLPANETMHDGKPRTLRGLESGGRRQRDERPRIKG